MIGSYASKKEKLVIGLMSGTSLDGVDAALVRLSGSGLETKAELVHFISRGYEPEVRERLINGGNIKAVIDKFAVKKIK